MSENYVIITGASNGLGYELACLIAKSKRNLLLIARSQDKLQAIQRDFIEQHSIKVEILVLDLSESQSTESILAFLDRTGIEIDILINNAGFGCYGEFIGSNIKDVINMMNLNMINLVRLTHSLLPRLARQPSATIMNIGSVAAYQPVPLLSAYAATKSFIVNFSQALSAELSHTTINVVCFCPGQFSSGFHKRSGMDVSRLFKYPMPGSKEVALLAHAALLSRKRLVIGGLFNKLSVIMTRFTPLSIVIPVTYFFMKPVAKK